MYNLYRISFEMKEIPPVNIAIVDDAEADRLSLENTLKEYSSIHHLDMTCSHFADAEAFLKEYIPFSYAVIFLDIYMPGLSGIETAEAVRRTDGDTAIVFLTTSDAHRPDAFSVFASDYLMKPVSREHLFRTLDHLFRIRTGSGLRFDFSYDRTDYSLLCSDIVSLEKTGNYLEITDRSGQIFRTRMTFSEAEVCLGSHFLTLRKGISVNMRYIKQIRNGQCLMANGAVFPLRVKDARELGQKWLNYKFAVIRGGAPQ